MAVIACGVIAAGFTAAPPTVAEEASIIHPQAAGQVVPFPARIEAKHLPNAVRVHERVISGGLPEGEAAFAELQRLGVKTVISVDGMTPDAATARKYGLRYIHLPHGYNGVPERRGLELAKAVLEAQGPVYIHCHHGKHRSPAAAAVACVAGGLIGEDAAAEALEVAQTSPHYRGLFQSVAAAREAGEGVLERLETDFVEVAPMPPMAEAMVELEHTFANLQTIAQENWGVPAKHPDLVPRHETLLLREHFTEMLRAEYTQGQPESFKEFLGSSEAAAAELEEALDRWRGPADRRANAASLQRSLDRVAADCKACHAAFRDVPLGGTCW